MPRVQTSASRRRDCYRPEAPAGSFGKPPKLRAGRPHRAAFLEPCDDPLREVKSHRHCRRCRHREPPPRCRNEAPQSNRQLRSQAPDLRTRRRCGAISWLAARQIWPPRLIPALGDGRNVTAHDLQEATKELTVFLQNFGPILHARAPFHWFLTDPHTAKRASTSSGAFHKTPPHHSHGLPGHGNRFNSLK